MGPVAQSIEAKLASALALDHLDVVNESASHSVPPGSESHFKVVLVSSSFVAASRIKRHRQINELLAEELAGPVHALSIHAYTPQEWQERFGEAPLSPPCLGGSKADAAGP